MSEENKRRCFSCQHYDAYYRKGLSVFNRLDYGICYIKDEPLQDKHGSCECWRGNYRRKAARKASALIILERTSEQLNEIRQILIEAEPEEG